MKAKRHPEAKPRGKRDPRECRDHSVGSRLVYIITIPGVYDRQPMFWTDRPAKFPSHVRAMLKRPGTVIEDIKWMQLAGKAWWRIPDWPDGRAES